MKKVSVIVASLLAVFFSACGGSSGDSTTDNTPFGSATVLKGLASCAVSSGEAVVCGTVKAADGVTPVVGAEIRYATPSGSISAMRGIYNGGVSTVKGVADATKCLSDASGNFACGGITENGTYTFYIQGGGVSLSFSLLVAVDSTATASATDTTATSTETTTKWLVVTGYWDGVQLLLSQLKSCTLTGDTSDPAGLTGSDACTAVNLVVAESGDISSTFSALSNISSYDSIFINCGTDMSDYATVLQQYVAQGGNLYFSDLADGGIRTAFPDKITFYDEGSTSSNDPGEYITGNVVNTDLATYLGKASINIAFDLGGWQAMSSVASGVNTYIRGDTSSLGGPSNAPITVGWKQGTGGCIFYTSYHIEGASTGSDQEKALKYLVQNIDSVCQ